MSTRTRTTHGMTGTSEHMTWMTMTQRCENPKATGYARYGGAGVKVCARWRASFEAFFADMGPKPSPEHSIDRFPNKEGDYEPGNCRWATIAEQQRNTSYNRWLEFRGERLVVSDWAKRIGITEGAIRYRLKLGWSVERTLTTPRMSRAEIGLLGAEAKHRPAVETFDAAFAEACTKAAKETELPLFMGTPES